MPLWKVYHPAGAYTPADKQAFAETMTEIYARFMPRFYVNVLFHEVGEDTLFIGGKPRNNFVRLTMAHIAREFPSEEGSRRFIDAVNRLIAPWVKDRGFDWEFHIDETPFDLWSIQGFYPPREGTADEARWIAENKPSPRTHD